VYARPYKFPVEIELPPLVGYGGSFPALAGLTQLPKWSEQVLPVVESVQESELGVEWLAAQGVAVDPLPEPLLGVAALPSMGRVAFEALLPEQATSVDQSAAPQLALVPVGAQSPSQTVPQLVTLALLVAVLVGEGAMELGGVLPLPPAPVQALSLPAELLVRLVPNVVNLG
jgi:hypothetical protein